MFKEMVFLPRSLGGCGLFQLSGRLEAAYIGSFALHSQTLVKTVPGATIDNVLDLIPGVRGAILRLRDIASTRGEKCLIEKILVEVETSAGVKNLEKIQRQLSEQVIEIKHAQVMEWLAKRAESGRDPLAVARFTMNKGQFSGALWDPFCPGLHLFKSEFASATALRLNLPMSGTMSDTFECPTCAKNVPNSVCHSLSCRNMKGLVNTRHSEVKKIIHDYLKKMVSSSEGTVRLGNDDNAEPFLASFFEQNHLISNEAVAGKRGDIAVVGLLGRPSVVIDVTIRDVQVKDLSKKEIELNPTKNPNAVCALAEKTKMEEFEKLFKKPKGGNSNVFMGLALSSAAGLSDEGFKWINSMSKKISVSKAIEWKTGSDVLVGDSRVAYVRNVAISISLVVHRKNASLLQQIEKNFKKRERVLEVARENANLGNPGKRKRATIGL
jgi:hypothetical protein